MSEREDSTVLAERDAQARRAAQVEFDRPALPEGPAADVALVSDTKEAA